MRSGIGGSRLPGIDSLNGVAYVCEIMDAATGTHYSENMGAYRAWCQKIDSEICASVSNPKGNRRLHAEAPKQAYKDFYVRIADRNKEGIFIEGCKLHMSESSLPNDLIVLPSRHHNEAGKDDAVVCAAHPGYAGVARYVCRFNGSPGQGCQPGPCYRPGNGLCDAQIGVHELRQVLLRPSVA